MVSPFFRVHKEGGHAVVETLDMFSDLKSMLDPNGKGYVLLDGVEKDNPTIAEALRIETE